MPLQSYDARIAYGSSQARTQKGLLGIKVWLCYDKTFQLQLSKDLKNYILNTIKI
jgi:ribosomal protein S3